jgi:ATP-dependent exoDNAse (exonuclease V) alpha subunit
MRLEPCVSEVTQSKGAVSGVSRARGATRTRASETPTPPGTPAPGPVRRGAPLTLDETLRIGTELAEALAAGDKVMQIENDCDKNVCNGDIGFVLAIEPDLGDVTVEYDGRPVLYGVHELDQVVLAYATTVHKAQGCEYPAVVIPVTTQHYPMLQRNLIYTGITRGRKLVVLVGQEKALAIAVRGSRAVRRWSKLGEWLANQPVSGLTTRTSP